MGYPLRWMEFKYVMLLEHCIFLPVQSYTKISVENDHERGDQICQVTPDAVAVQKEKKGKD